MEEKRNAYRIFVGKPKRKKPLGRPRRCVGIILMRILESWDDVVWTGLIWLRLGTSSGLLWPRL
jgi:hypothetical protein